MELGRSNGGRILLAMAVLVTATSAGRAERFTWTIDAGSTVTTTLTASYGQFEASDTKTSGVGGTFGGVLGLPAYDVASVLFDQANVGYTSNPTFNLSFGGFFGGVNVTTNGLGFAIPGANGLSSVPTTPFPVALDGAFTQTDTGVEGRGTMAYAGYGIAGAGVGSGSINLVDLSPIPGTIAGTLTQVGNQIRLTTPLSLDQTTTLENGVTVRAQITADVIANATTTAGGWKVDAGGSFTTAANWSSGVAPAAGTSIDTAVFGNVITAPRTIALPTTSPLKVIVASAIPYTFTGTLNTVAGAANVPAIDVRAGSGHRVAAISTLKPINVEAGAQLIATTMTFHLRKTGDGTLRVETGNVSDFQANAGTIQIGTSLRVTEGLTFGTTGKLDVASGLFEVTAFTPTLQTARLNLIRQELFEGRAGGAWNGNGIISSTLATGGAVGYRLDGSLLTARKTLGGDATLNGAVDFDDLLALAKNFNTATYWTGGDFDYDGTTDFDDLLILAKNFNKSSTPASAFDELSPDFAAEWALAQSLVPEPATLGAFVAGCLTLRARRRSR